MSCSLLAEGKDAVVIYFVIMIRYLIRYILSWFIYTLQSQVWRPGLSSTFPPRCVDASAWLFLRIVRVQCPPTVVVVVAVFGRPWLWPASQDGGEWITDIWQDQSKPLSYCLWEYQKKLQTRKHWRLRWRHQQRCQILVKLLHFLRLPLLLLHLSNRQRTQSHQSEAFGVLVSQHSDLIVIWLSWG